MLDTSYRQIINDNRQLMKDLIGYIYPGMILEFPTNNLSSQRLNFDTMVKSASGKAVAIINSSVRMTSARSFSSAILDESKANALLSRAHIAPVFVAGWYKTDGTLDLDRLDEHGCKSKTAKPCHKQTPLTFVNQQKVMRRLLEIPFSACWLYTYKQRQLKLQQIPQSHP